MGIMYYVIIACIPPLTLLMGDASTGLVLLILSLVLPASRQFFPVTREGLFRSTATPVLLLLTAPALYLIFQMLPIPGISNPAWQSAASAQGQGMTGAITLDIGATFLALARYCIFAGMLLLSMIVGMTRGRALRVLIAILAGVTLSIAFCWLNRLYPGSSIPPDGRAAYTPADEGVLACGGLILSLAFAIHLVASQSKSRKNDGDVPPRWYWLVLAASAIISSLSVLDLGKTAVFIASALGCAVLALVVMVRRLGPWAGGALATTSCIVVLMLVSNSGTVSSTFDSTLKFGSQPPAVSTTVQRMLGDLPGFGTGAGTFHELYELYGVVDPDSQIAIASTPLSAVLSVEFGKVAFWIMICVLLAAAVWFVVSAVLRGRDWIYPAACAALIVVWIPLCFGASMQGRLDALTLGAAMFGLGIVQSRSRHSEP